MYLDFILSFLCFAGPVVKNYRFRFSKFQHIGYIKINGEREIPGRQKVVRGSNVQVLTSHAGLNPRSKSGYEREARVINGERGIHVRNTLNSALSTGGKPTLVSTLSDFVVVCQRQNAVLHSASRLRLSASARLGNDSGKAGEL